MNCSSPLKALIKTKLDGSFYAPIFTKFKSDLEISALHDQGWTDIDIPCGQCFECRMNDSRDWAVRLTLESSLYKNNYFFTFTYDDGHLPLNFNAVVSPVTGEVFDEFFVPTVRYDDMVLFNKRLRDHIFRDFGLQIRVLFVGEYGDKSQRPHYHAIYLNMPSLSQLQATVYRSKPFLLYESNYISRIWKKGWCPFAVANFADISYVCRYILKKYKGKRADVEKFYSKQGIDPEKRFPSRKPGIGAPWFDCHRDSLLETDFIACVPTSSGAFKCSLPRYFENRFIADATQDELSAFRILKQKRLENSQFQLEQELAHTSLSKEAYLGIKHDNLIDRLSCLRNRDLKFHTKR